MSHAKVWSKIWPCFWTTKSWQILSSKWKTKIFTFTKLFLLVSSSRKCWKNENLLWMLLARSSVFMTMFTGEFEEKKTSAGIIKNISHDAFSDFLRYLYSDSVNNLKSHVIELLAVAHMYEVQGLKKLCESELLRGLSEENSADIFQYAHLYQCDRSLKEASFNLIKR